jgi:hypothetical protein
MDAIRSTATEKSKVLKKCFNNRMISNDSVRKRDGWDLFLISTYSEKEVSVVIMTFWTVKLLGYIISTWISAQVFPVIVTRSRGGASRPILTPTTTTRNTTKNKKKNVMISYEEQQQVDQQLLLVVLSAFDKLNDLVG